MGRGRTRRDSVGTPEFAFQDRCLQPLGHHTGSSKSPLRLGGLRNQASAEVTLTGPYIDELIDGKVLGPEPPEQRRSEGPERSPDLAHSRRRLSAP
jgi:hypothetical protein